MVSSSGSCTPSAEGFYQPAEWEPHAACLTAWPAYEFAWGDALADAQRELVAFARAFAAAAGQEPLHVLLPLEPELQQHARDALAGVPGLYLRPFPYGDVWLRDTAPVFLRRRAHDTVGHVRFAFNGWGGKFVYPHDAELAARLGAEHGGRSFRSPLALEGGAIEVDGEGTCLTTRSCVLHANRGAPSEEQAAAAIRDAFGVTRVIWLDAGLLGDHTDGHVDNLARFVAPGAVVCMQAHDGDDPNRDTLSAIARALAEAVDARGRRLRVQRIPSPGRVPGRDGGVMPASYMNFYIGNRRVLVPGFGTRWDEPARRALAALFPDRDVVLCRALALLEGGGTLHCMTQQVPAP